MISAESLYRASPTQVLEYLAASLGTSGYSVAGGMLEIDLPAPDRPGTVVGHVVESFSRFAITHGGTKLSHVLPEGRSSTLCGLPWRPAPESDLEEISCEECRVKALAVEVAFPSGAMPTSRPAVAEDPAIAQYFSALQSKAASARPASERVLDWAGSRHIAPTYEPKKSELRFRAPATRAGGASGASIFTLISSNGGVTVQLRHLLSVEPFANDRSLSDELVTKLSSATASWTRPPSDRNFPHVRLTQMAWHELDVLLIVFDWILGRLAPD